MSKPKIEQRTVNEFYFTYSSKRAPELKAGSTFEHNGRTYTIKQSYMSIDPNGDYYFLVITQ